MNPVPTARLQFKASSESPFWRELQQAAAMIDQAYSILQIQYPRNIRGCNLTHTMPGNRRR